MRNDWQQEEPIGNDFDFSQRNLESAKNEDKMKKEEEKDSAAGVPDESQEVREGSEEDDGFFDKISNANDE